MLGSQHATAIDATARTSQPELLAHLLVHPAGNPRAGADLLAGGGGWPQKVGHACGGGGGGESGEGNSGGGGGGLPAVARGLPAAAAAIQVAQTSLFK